MTILQRVNLRDLETKEKPLWWQKQGLSLTASGYGLKIPTTTMARLPGDKRWRRIYCCIFSNLGTSYVLKNGDWVVII